MKFLGLKRAIRDSLKIDGQNLFSGKNEPYEIVGAHSGSLGLERVYWCSQGLTTAQGTKEPSEGH